MTTRILLIGGILVYYLLGVLAVAALAELALDGKDCKNLGVVWPIVLP